MAADVVTSLIAASGAVVLAALTYWLTKKRERENEIRKEKLEHYKDFILSLSGVVSGDATPEAQRAFARACNRLNLVAPQRVIKALQDFQDEIKITNPRPDRSRHDHLMSALINEMRRDLGFVGADENPNFVFGLWASGAPPVQESRG